MKKSILILVVLLGALSVKSQFVMKMEMKVAIEGICDKDEVYALFSSFDDQDEAVCPINEEELEKKLNSEIKFLKENKKFKSKKGVINLIINCKGELIQSEMSNTTGSKELDKQLEDFFNSLGEWSAGKLDGKPVDSTRLIGFKIKKGVLKLN